MPTIVRIRLMPESDVLLHLENTPAQGLFLQIARRTDPDWAAALHRTGPVDLDTRRTRAPHRPYSLSPLYTAPTAPIRDDDLIGGRALASGSLRAGKPVSLRIALADDDRAEAVLHTLSRTREQPLRLGSALCRLTRVPVFAIEDPDVLHTPWSQMIAAAPADRLRLEFTTPAVFLSQNDQVPLPVPKRLWDNWRAAWSAMEAFGAPRLPETGADAADETPFRISAYELATSPRRVKSGLFIGFQGWVELGWRPDIPAERRCVGIAAAWLAVFLGTGAKTSHGLGQTRLHLAFESRPQRVVPPEEDF